MASLKECQFMCGIIGYVGKKKVLPILLNGLSHLEYRGYDSAGVACLGNNGTGLVVIKEKGKLQALQNRTSSMDLSAFTGVGHTRWATHGEPSQQNAHPHTDCRKEFALVHNGIVENYESIRRELTEKGHKFTSQTDTEVLVHLIEEYNRGNIPQAIRRAVKKTRGYFAFVLISTKNPGKLFAFKRSNPLVVGLGKDENFVASDVPALLPYTRKVIYLEDDEYAVIEKEKVRIFSLNGTAVKRKTLRIEWSVSEAQKKGFSHFMLKEIYEQPHVISESIRRHFSTSGDIYFDSFTSKIDQMLKKIKKVFIVSCGTAYHAGLVGRYMIEQYAKIPTEVQVSSEFRYNDPIVSQGDVVILITQSGETADTLAALREAKKKGATIVAIVNVVGSTIAREADVVIYTHAGPEIGVASTKAYTAQLITLVFFSFYLAKLRNTLSPKELSAFKPSVRKLPKQIGEILKFASAVEKCANKYYRKKNFLYLARGYNYPNALEGALKLKEISYAHAHGYPAGEMKHGPIALIDKELPVICIAPQSKTYEKMISNIEEIRARGGIVVTIGTTGDMALKKLSSDFLPIPLTTELLSPILTVIPLQIFAYWVAVLNGRDVDQPRNLAKSVTVE